MNVMETTELLANFADIVAALGVVISLIYLAVQVRDNSRLVSENTKAQLMAADISSNDGTREVNLEIIKDPELASLIRRGLSGDDLDEIDRQRFAQWVRMITESHMTYFVQLERGIVTGEIFEYWSRNFDRLCTRPAFTRSWNNIRNDFMESFRDYIDAKIPPDLVNPMRDQVST